MKYTTRPLSDRTWLRPQSKRRPSQFKAPWPDTLELLYREVGHLRGRNLVIEVDVTEADLRLDGTIRARAAASSPAVVVAFESTHGPMLYRADALTTNASWQGPAWQHNVRAVALTLEALRSVDRYGATETGQQYQGFKALPTGRAMPASHMTADEAWSVLGSFGPYPTVEETRTHGLEAAHRRARAATHPDRHGGDRTLWDQVEQAAAVLGVASR